MEYQILETVMLRKSSESGSYYSSGSGDYEIELDEMTAPPATSHPCLVTEDELVERDKHFTSLRLCPGSEVDAQEVDKCTTLSARVESEPTAVDSELKPMLDNAHDTKTPRRKRY